MRVEVDLFSGRPNPSFNLDTEQSTALASMLDGLLPGGEPREPPGLGYRGFVIRDAAPVLPGCTELRAFGGTVVSSCVDTRVLADPGRSVEEWLLNAGRPHLDRGVYDAVSAEFRRR